MSLRMTATGTSAADSTAVLTLPSPISDKNALHDCDAPLSGQGLVPGSVLYTIVNDISGHQGES